MIPERLCIISAPQRLKVIFLILTESMAAVSCGVDLIGPFNLFPPEVPSTGHFGAMDFELTSISPTSIRLTWTNAAYSDGVHGNIPPVRSTVERRTSITPFSVLSSIPGGVTMYLDNSLDTTYQYWYRVNSVFADSTRVISEEVPVAFTASFSLTKSFTLAGAVSGTLAVSRDGRYFAAAYNDHTIRLGDAESGVPIGDIGSSPYPFFNVNFSPSGKHVAANTTYYDSISRSTKPEILIFSTSTANRTHNLRRQDGVYSIVIDERDSVLISTGYNPMIVLWDLKHSHIRAEMNIEGNSSNFVAISPDGSLFAVNHQANHCYDLVRTTDATFIRSLAGLNGNPYWIDFSGDGQTIVACTSSANIICWRFDDGQVLHLFDASIPHQYCIYQAICPDNAYIIANYGNNQIIFWGPLDGVVHAVIRDQPIGPLMVTNDGKSLFLCGPSSYKIWSLSPQNAWTILPR
jgi:WD40 repeat protein